MLVCSRSITLLSSAASFFSKCCLSCHALLYSLYWYKKGVSECANKENNLVFEYKLCYLNYIRKQKANISDRKIIKYNRVTIINNSIPTRRHLRFEVWWQAYHHHCPQFLKDTTIVFIFSIDVWISKRRAHNRHVIKQLVLS